MKVSSIELQHTNPSLGPNEIITVITLQSNSITTSTIEEFIKNSIINPTCALSEYLEAELKADNSLIQKVYDNSPKNKLNEGEQISNLIFHFEEGNHLKISDVYRRFSLTNFYGDFTKYMVTNGSVVNNKDNSIEDLRIDY